jgi:hypothetical protein
VANQPLTNQPDPAQGLKNGKKKNEEEMYKKEYCPA